MSNLSKTQTWQPLKSFKIYCFYKESYGTRKKTIIELSMIMLNSLLYAGI